MADKVAVFIDGGYLNKIHDTKIKIDYSKLVNELVAPNTLQRAYYYNCLPYMPINPTAKDNERFANVAKFHDSLNHIPRMCVRLGKLRFKGNDAATGKPIFEQKRVDLMLGIDIASIATSRSVDSIVLLSGDGDMHPAIEIAKSSHVIVFLAHGEKKSYDQALWDNADERILLDDVFFRKVELK